MGEKLYRLIPEPGKHLANSKDTFGAVRGVYLDDKTNKPSGAGEFMPVDTNSTGVSPAVVGALVTLGLAAGYGIAKATPYSIKNLPKYLGAIRGIFMLFLYFIHFQ